MATIMSMPFESIKIILSEESISIKDIMSFALTCKKFNALINYPDNVFWRNKFYQEWPFLREEYDKLICKKNIDFLEQIKTGINSRKKLWHCMSLTSERHHYDDLCSDDLKDLHSLFDPDKDAYFMNYNFLVNELIKLLLQPSKESDMTERYHAKVLLLYLHHYYLSNKWDKFVNYPVQQILEEAATILAQCHQPKRYVSYIYVRKSLDNIAQQVFECLKNEYPTHPILSISDEQFSFWKDNNINDNHWKNKEVKQILESLCEVLQNKLGFQNCGESAASFSLEYSCIDFVLKNKCGTGQLLGIIYHSVARRLGIHCDVKTGRSVFVCWKPKYGNIKSEDQKGFYIDVSHCDSIPNSNSSSMFNTTKMPIKLLSFDNYKNGCICYVPIIPRMRKYSKISVGTDTKAIKTKRTNENEIVIRLSPELTSLKNKIQKYLAECT